MDGREYVPKPLLVDEAVAAFAQFDDEEQAAFFNQLADAVKQYRGSASMQWSWMVEHMSPEGRSLLRDMADQLD